MLGQSLNYSAGFDWLTVLLAIMLETGISIKQTVFTSHGSSQQAKPPPFVSTLFWINDP